MLLVIIGIAAGFFIVERLWPANALPKVHAWWPRIVLVNSIQLGIVILAGLTWDRWLRESSLLRLDEIWAGRDFLQGAVAYLVSTFVYYWWHRLRHNSRIFWRLCHQLHHSPTRIELVTSFYKHPVEITLNSILSAAIVYSLLGGSAAAGGWCTLLAAVGEFFYHWNIRTPRWIGRIVQRPESHRIHHRFQFHTLNFADLPVWDWLFGTYHNPEGGPVQCGFDDWRAERFDDMLAFRDTHAKGAEISPPLHLLPTCIGCRKRWACAEARQREGTRPKS